MAELHSKKDIEKISHEILNGSKSFDVFPTPIDQIVAYTELLVRKDIDVSKIHAAYFSKANDALRRALSKVRGVLDRRERTIYLDLSQGKHKIGFVKLHEVGHDVLPWQKKIHDILDDDDDSLNPETHEEFEAEASFFASATLFQNDRFTLELDKLGLGIDSCMQLSKLFGASIHATLRRYVEYSKNKCALIVLENISKNGSPVKCDLKDIFQSEKFTATFGQIKIPLTLGYKWPFVQDYYFKRKFKLNGAITLLTANGNVDFTYQFFDNSYNAFVFLFPVRERKSTRTKIIITGAPHLR
jgi:Zn-dependent peptidase ImmA (M78 family)